jgi:hypothetical protein
LGLPVQVVRGNNLGDAVSLIRFCSASGGLISYYGQDADLMPGGKCIFATHYPHYGRAIACAGDHDLVCVRP